MATRRLQWGNSSLTFAPKPHWRPSATRPVSLSQADKTCDDRTEEKITSENCSRPHTDDEEEKFYDAVPDPTLLEEDLKDDTREEKEEIVRVEAARHARDSEGASAANADEIRESAVTAWFEIGSKDVKGADVKKEEIVLKETPQHTEAGEGVSPVEANKVSESDSSLKDAKSLQKAEVTREVSTLPLEKLKFLNKLRQKQIINEQCKVHVDPDRKTLVLTGTDDDITTTELSIYGALANVAMCSLSISKELGNLIISPKGQRWFDEVCERRGFVGMCYVHNAATRLLAAGDEMACAMRKWFTDALLSERKPLESHQKTFVQSQQWTDLVSRFTDSQTLLLITLNSSKAEIVVEGLVDAVQNALREIDDLLSRHCRVNKKLSLKPADFQVLSLRSTDIVNEVQDLVVQQQR